ncbi:Gfo/Idh/MocA family protein [candidate division KSB1 bacterium]
MKIFNIGIIMNGVTGRMGTNQHLIRSILEIRKQGGVKTSSGEIIIPEPVLLGRNESKLKNLAHIHNLNKYSTDIDACLSDPFNKIYFDALKTDLRVENVRKAIKAGKAVYCEKPAAANFDDAYTLYKEAAENGLKNGVVQDKLWLPGILKLKHLIDSGFFGKILSVRGEFGYWVFDGKIEKVQRPSWNYKKEEGGSIILDMFPHWRYIIDNLFGEISSISCFGATHIDKRLDETGDEYKCTADDAAYAAFRCSNGIICNFNSSWAVRVRRDDLLTIQVDGTRGSAAAGLRKCYAQTAESTPKFVWNPDVEMEDNPFDNWEEVLPDKTYDNAFKLQWELFLRHVVNDEPFKWTLLEGAKGVQLAEIAVKSWEERRWIDVPELSV